MGRYLSSNSAYLQASSKQQLTVFSTVIAVQVAYMRKLLMKYRFMLCTSGTSRKAAKKYLGWSPSSDRMVRWQNPSIRINNTAVWA